jgi:hypothetical protein
MMASIAAAILLAAGCGGVGVAKVSGTVTDGGKPLDKAWVKFSPLAGGRPSHARTDASGAFRLEYKDLDGALVGRHRVQIGTGGEVDDRGNPISRSVERLTTEVEVTSGNNEFRFDVASSP